MTTYKKKKLKDREGNYIVTPSSADIVYCQDGSTVEQKLNNIENDEFSPTITQVESMAKVGVGTDVDVSANVQDGYVKSAILKGNTKVNLIQESSSQDVVLPYEFEEGQYVTINDTKESGAVGVELKGQTLVNLMNNTPIYENGNCIFELNYKVNEVTIFNYNNLNIYCSFWDLNDNWLDLEIFRDSVIHINKPDKKLGCIQMPITDANITQFEQGKFVILEGNHTNKDIPYFEGMQSVEAPSVKTVGKNLFDGELELGSFGENGENVSATSCVRSKNLIRVKPNTLYTFSNDKDYAQYVLQFDENKNKIYAQSYTSFTTLPNTHYIKFRTSQGTNQNDVTVKYQLEESPTATTYEPYKSTTLTLPEEITLRGIGNVKDTLNTVTGEYTQRIGEVVLDGSENWWQNVFSDTIARFIYKPSNKTSNNPRAIISDKFPSNSDTLMQESIFQYTNEGIIVAIARVRLSQENVEGFKQYLSQNPITVQYELATPITKKLSLTFTDQDNAPTTKLSTYNTTTHINASSKEGSLIPTLSHVNPSYPVILKPSTKYSIVADSYSNGHTNSTINFNLGGATTSTTVGSRVTTVTTPSTLTSEKLVTSGRGNMLNNVMVIEGDVVGDEPYFEGMCDVKSYKTLENLQIKPNQWYINTGNDSAYCNQKIPLSKLKPNTKYLIKFNKEICKDINRCYFIQSNSMTVLPLHEHKTGSYVLFTTTAVLTEKDDPIHIYPTKTGGLTNEMIEGLYVMLLEYQPDMENWDIPYFEGTANIQRPMVTNVGKNLFDISSFETGVEDGFEVAYLNNYTPSIIYKENTQYTVRFNSKYRNGYATKVIITHTDGSKVESMFSTTSFTTTILKSAIGKSVKSITFRQNINDNSNCYGVYVIKGTWIEESPTATTYEPYKSNILSCNSEVVLRSLPNGICDTLDLMTGEYTQRIGEVVLDGSEDEGWMASGYNNSLSEIGCIQFYTPSFKQKLGNVIICDKFVTGSSQDWDNTSLQKSFITLTYIKDIGVRILTTSINTSDLDGFKTYLQQNPITVQYELETPITATIDLAPSGTNPTTKPFVWKDGHVQLLSEQGTLTPSSEYSVITSRGGQILDNTRQIAKQDKRIYDLEMLLISSSIEDAYQRLALQNSVQMLNYNEELKVNPIRYYMLSRLIEEEMYQESDMLDKLDAFLLYGEINTEQYYGLSEAIVGDNAIATLEEVIASHEIQVDIPTTLEELPSDRPTTLEEQPIIEEVEDAPIVELKDCSKTYTLLMNKLELSIQRVEDLAHYVDLANAYICANRLSYEEYELVIARIENAYISLH